MNRHAQKETDALVRGVDLIALVRSRGIVLLRADTGVWTGPCPFHQDKANMLVIEPRGQLFACSACGAAGNAAAFVSRFDGVSRRHAQEILAGECARSFRPNMDVPLKRSTVLRLENPFSGTSGADVKARPDAELLAQATDYYRGRLRQNAPAMRFIQRLGPRAAEAIEHFGLGFADRTLGLRLPQANRREGRILRSRLCRIGILRPNGREHLNGCVVLPIAGAHGGVVALHGCRIGRERQRGSGPWRVMQPAARLDVAEAVIWNADGLDGGDIILTDTPFDALFLWARGFTNVTFAPGTNPHRLALFAALLHKRCARVRLAYAATEAGDQSAARDAAQLANRGIEALRVPFPLGKSACTFGGTKALDSDPLSSAIRAACWMTPVTTTARDADCVAAHATETPSAVRALAQQVRQAAPHPVWVAQGLDCLTMRRGALDYRAEGLARLQSIRTLRITLMLTVHPEDGSLKTQSLYLDRFDMARDSCRRRFAAMAAEETGVDAAAIRQDLGGLLLAIEEHLYTQPAPWSAGMPKEPEGQQRTPALPPRTVEALERLRRASNGSQQDKIATQTRSCFLTRRQIGDQLGLGATQTRLHVERLSAAGLMVLRRRGPRRTARYSLRTVPLPYAQPSKLGGPEPPRSMPECRGKANEHQLASVQEVAP